MTAQSSPIKCVRGSIDGLIRALHAKNEQLECQARTHAGAQAVIRRGGERILVDGPVTLGSVTEVLQTPTSSSAPHRDIELEQSANLLQATQTQVTPREGSLHREDSDKRMASATRE